MASERRTFLNKINKRVKALENAGVGKQELLDWLNDKNIDGVFITEFGQINIDPIKWAEDKELYIKELEQAMPTVYHAKEDALLPYKDFIGPLSKNQINEELKAMFEMRTKFDSQLFTYYELKDEAERALKNMEENRGYEDALFKLDEIWKAARMRKVPFTRLLKDVRDIEQLL